MIWFTSDSHLGHENIIKYAKRPFSNVTEMDDEIIGRWNEVVSDDDVVYHLGDFTLRDYIAARSYFNRLSGCINILKYPSHHDRKWLEGHSLNMQGYLPQSRSDHSVRGLDSLITLEYPGRKCNEHSLPIVLCHYPLAEWDRKHYGAWHLHGHSHGKYDSSPRDFIMDVGVDCHDFYPVSLDYVAKIMKQRGWYPRWRKYE